MTQRLPVLTLLAWATLAPCAMAENAPLRSTPVQVEQRGEAQALEAVLEAVRQTTLSTQIAGAIVALQVKAGDRVQAGQVLLQVDGRTAQDQVSASRAQTQAAQAQLKVAQQELERQQKLFQQNYISQAALERAQAQWEAAQAQTLALQAQAQSAQTQNGFFVVRAPYAGVVSELAVSLGDLALPGRPLLTIYDPRSLRISASVPQSLLPHVTSQLANLRYELPDLGQSAKSAKSAELLPSLDPKTHTATLRLLPHGPDTAWRPGLFARVWVAGKASTVPRLYVPSGSVVRRGEMTGVYVLNEQGQALLRQVRVGPSENGRTEILSGVRANEPVALDPAQATATR